MMTSRAEAECGMQNAERAKQVVFLCVLFFSLFRSSLAAGCASDGRYVMGTVLEITLCADGTTRDRRSFDDLFAAAARFDSLLTTYVSDSPISRLNTQAGRGPTRVPPEVADVLSLSLRYGQQTNGTFDVTVGPLMTLWRQAVAAQVRPSAAALRRARARVGSAKIRFFTNGTVSLARKGMVLDLGGIGKGYALDQLAGILKQQHMTTALLDFGQSSMWALGAPPNANGWRLLLQQPNGKSVGTITLRDQAFSVSGSMGQTFAINGQQYGHVIDPRSGEPLRRDLLACVIAPTAAQAEALSKALLILGEQEGIAFLQRLPGVEGMLTEANGQRGMTPGWARAVTFVPL